MVDRLEYLRRKLSETGATVSVRGTGAAAFVFAERNGRAIEASLKNNDWWVEFWEVDEDEDAAPVDEKTVSGDSGAFEVAMAWLMASAAG